TYSRNWRVKVCDMTGGNVEGKIVVCVTRTDDVGKYLLLERSGEKPEEGKWTFPSGKVQENEEPEQAALRELEEETGLEGTIERRGEEYVTEEETGRWKVHPFLVEVDDRDIEKNEEHSDHGWFTPLQMTELDTLGSFESLEKLDLINGDVVTVVIERQGEYLMLKRSEEKSSSGYWNFPGGRIEDEGVEDAALREAEEEAGVEGRAVETGEPYLSSGELGFWRIHPVLIHMENESVELNWEHSEYKWVKPDEIKEMKSLSSTEAFESLDLM
ncbi:MAG: NUDIX domain-containing protein, partial [Candidatus Aenigmatarchaeota archaeon]